MQHPPLVLTETSPAAAKATVERLRQRGIGANIADEYQRPAGKGPPLVRVTVAAEELERARAELAEWEREAAPRMRPLQREVALGVLGSLVPPALLLAWLFTREAAPRWGPSAVLGTWVGCVCAWVVWSRLKAERRRRRGR